MIKINTILIFNACLGLLLSLLFGCQANLNTDAGQSAISVKNDLNNRLSIARVDEMMNEAKNSQPGPIFSDSTESEGVAFTSTPMGAYLQNWTPALAQKEQIEKVIPELINSLYENPVCKTSCSKEFLKEYTANRDEIRNRILTIVNEASANEIQNHENFTVFYHAFPNEFRLYQDVLRALKSFEFLTKLTTTYPLRDISFDDDKISLSEFLKDWWANFVKYADEQKVSPFPTEEAPGRVSTGLSFYPDSIPYAADRLLSTNVNLLGNSLSPKSNSLFFFLNSISAAGSDIVDALLEKTLSAYVLAPDGKPDSAKLATIITNLKTIFDKSLAKSGGQLAQIFITKRVAPEMSFMAWSGGEPLWLSQKTGRVVTKEENSFIPPNIFWPTLDQQNEIALFNVVDFMDLFIKDPQKLASVFPVESRSKTLQASELLKIDVQDPRIKSFLSQDTAQARLLANPAYFTDEAQTGVKFFTRNIVNAEEEQSYNQAIFDVVRDVIADFLATASETNFKPGSYKLKSAFTSPET